MNALELMDAMSVDACMKGGGVWSANDVLQNRFKRPTFLIVNTAESHKLGSHWVTIYLPDTGPVEFFDSFGQIAEPLPSVFSHISAKLWFGVHMEYGGLSIARFYAVWRILLVFRLPSL